MNVEVTFISNKPEKYPDAAKAHRGSAYRRYS